MTNTKSTYGWVAIAPHFISAVGAAALYPLGEQMEEVAARAAKIFA